MRRVAFQCYPARRPVRMGYSDGRYASMGIFDSQGPNASPWHATRPAGHRRVFTSLKAVAPVPVARTVRPRVSMR